MASRQTHPMDIIVAHGWSATEQGATRKIGGPGGRPDLPRGGRGGGGLVGTPEDFLPFFGLFWPDAPKILWRPQKQKIMILQKMCPWTPPPRGLGCYPGWVGGSDPRLRKKMVACLLRGQASIFVVSPCLSTLFCCYLCAVVADCLLRQPAAVRREDGALPPAGRCLARHLRQEHRPSLPPHCPGTPPPTAFTADQTYFSLSLVTRRAGWVGPPPCRGWGQDSGVPPPPRGDFSSQSR